MSKPLSGAKVMEDNQIEISVKGKWVKAPAVEFEDKFIVLKGTGVKTAQVHDEEWMEDEVSDPEACVKLLKAQKAGLHPDVFTFTQKLPATQPKYDYPMEWDSVAVARTTTFKSWWEDLPQETRKNVRRSQKRDVAIRVVPFGDDLIRGIMSVNDDSPVRQRKVNVHYGKSFEQVKRDQSSFLSHCDYIAAYVGEEMIGFLKLVYRGNVASLLNIVGKASHYDKRPTNALLSKAVELCEARGVSHLVYGKFNYGNKADSPLREFKVRNGFSEILVPRYYVPVTALGAAWIKLGMHRGLLGILPHRVIIMGVRARASWYNLSHQ